VLRVRLDGADAGALELEGAEKVDGPGLSVDEVELGDPVSGSVPKLVRVAVERARDVRERVVQVVAAGDQLQIDVAGQKGKAGSTAARKVRAVTLWPDEHECLVGGGWRSGCRIPQNQILHVDAPLDREELHEPVAVGSSAAVTACACEPLEAVCAHQDHPQTVIANDATALFDGVDPLPLDTFRENAAGRQRGSSSCRG
jgi:hypothetical protein